MDGRHERARSAGQQPVDNYQTFESNLYRASELAGWLAAVVSRRRRRTRGVTARCGTQRGPSGRPARRARLHRPANEQWLPLREGRTGTSDGGIRGARWDARASDAVMIVASRNFNAIASRDIKRSAEASINSRRDLPNLNHMHSATVASFSGGLSQSADLHLNDSHYRL